MNVRQPDSVGPFPVSFLLHGWTGDENSMKIFTNILPVNHLIIAPRAIYSSKYIKTGGYSWAKNHSGGFWPGMDDFRSAEGILFKLIETLSKQYEGEFDKINLIGFSQGAALSYVFACSYPQLVNRMVSLAGFMPDCGDQVIAKNKLLGVRVFMAHGIKDSIVPIEMARAAQKFLTRAGAQVEFCQSNSGHKIDKDCLSAITRFMM